MARVMRRPQAEEDIIEIWAYIAEDSAMEADRWIDGLDEHFRLWATQPLAGRRRDEVLAGLRSLGFGRYVVFYEALADGIDVVRVLHGAQDIDAEFREQGAQVYREA